MIDWKAWVVSPLVLSLSKDEPSCSWFDKLTTSETYKRDAAALPGRFSRRLFGPVSVEGQP